MDESDYTSSLGTRSRGAYLVVMEYFHVCTRHIMHKVVFDRASGRNAIHRWFTPFELNMYQILSKNLSLKK